MGVVSTVISLFVAVLVIKGDAQSFSCDSNITQPLCPGTITKCTCAITGAITQWSFTTLNLCPNISNIITLVQISPCSLSSPSSSGTCGAYLSAINSPTQANSACPLSTLTITASQSLNGLTIECRDATFGPGTLIGTRNITITAPPSTPNITSLISTYSDQLTVTWTSVPTATSYNVNINDSANTKSSTGAQQYTFTGLTNNTVYTVSVVAINNCAESSSPATISNRTSNGPTAPPPVTSATVPKTVTSTSSVTVAHNISITAGLLVVTIILEIFI